MKTCTVINGNLLHRTGIKRPGDTVELPDDAAELHRAAGVVAIGVLTPEEVEAARLAKPKETPAEGQPENSALMREADELDRGQRLKPGRAARPNTSA